MHEVNIYIRGHIHLSIRISPMKLLDRCDINLVLEVYTESYQENLILVHISPI